MGVKAGCDGWHAGARPQRPLPGAEGLAQGEHHVQKTSPPRVLEPALEGNHHFLPSANTLQHFQGG